MPDANTPIDELELPEAVTAADRLRLLYDHPGPYVSVYLATRPHLDDSDARTTTRWSALRSDLESQGAEPKTLAAIDARLALPAPDDAAAVAVLAAADATTVVDYGQEPPSVDTATIDALPYAAPLLEWHQRRVPHLVVTIDDTGADIATFGPDRYTRLDSIDGATHDLATPIAAVAESTHARLILVDGHPFATRRLADELAKVVPFGCRVVAEPGPASVDDLADAAVRHVSDTAARTTVGFLRELRFLASHSAAVDGTADTIAALREQRADVLLIHDDPADQRRIWIGEEPQHLSLESRPGYDRHARLVDAAIRAAVMTDSTVHIIPTTGATGPEDNTAVLSRTQDPPRAS